MTCKPFVPAAPRAVFVIIVLDPPYVVKYNCEVAVWSRFGRSGGIGRRAGLKHQ